MANQEHLSKLKEGIEAWNQWRDEHSVFEPDLSGADLSGIYLINANLRAANLRAANLSITNLSYACLAGANLNDANLTHAHLAETDLDSAQLKRADLREAQLKRADLKDADCSRADLRKANLYSAKLEHTNLSYADLSHAHLDNASFNRTDLEQVNLSGAYVGGTIFINVDLSITKGLDTVNHHMPSTIGIDTVYHSQGNIPDIFLKGAGIDDAFITYIRSLVGHAIEHYSCFISYSSKDEAFAKRLYADLQSHNVRCWFAPEDLKIGEDIPTGIDEAIRLHDKLLLILSKSSVASGWVEHEVKTALAKERKEKQVSLFPVRLDKAILESPLFWATKIRRERNIGDFTRWKDHDAYQKAFTRLLGDLKADTQKTEEES